MSAISKQALVVDNSQSFPNNNAGAITPTALRNFNTNMIDSNVNQTEYNTNSGSWNVSISNLNTFTASQQPTFNALNSFTASQLTINTGVNTTTQSLNGSVTKLNQATASLNTFTSSINQILVNGVSIGTSTRLFFNGYVSASIVANVDGPIASITILADQTFTPSASFNAYTASTNQFTASAKISIDLLNTNSASVNTSISNINSFSSSTINSLSALNAFTASDNTSQAALNTFTASATISINSINVATASLQSFSASAKIELANIESFTSSLLDTNAFTASAKVSITNLNSYTASNDSKWNAIGLLTGSYATTGSNSFIGNQTISGSFTLTGSVYSNIISASIVSSTASIDLNKGNFFTLTIPASANTHLNIQNVAAGQTALIEINTVGTLSTASFSTNVYQPSASFYVPTNAAGTDILTLTSFASNKIYLASVKTMINA